MRFYYRISDKGYQKTKLPGASKAVCLQNFLKVFGTAFVEIIADNCEPDTLQMVQDTGCRYTVTNLGNSGSMLYVLEDAIEKAADDEICYFVEDDYLHQDSALYRLGDGPKVAPYFTLYDHPDKYGPAYDHGEVSKVMRINEYHWRRTVSTCMTFGTTGKYLREDRDLFLKHCAYEHPHDHFLFTELGAKGHHLAVAIPGVACHTDLTVSGNIGKVVIDTWAIRMMLTKLYDELTQVDQDPVITKWVLSTCGIKDHWERLTHLDAIKSHLSNK